ncbi:hypothetical protein PSTT_07987 [Puccinia striiformis]|uniref:Uncharacterized protein n=1 Tax=Puccinia striiformis TaxID=27350 RepID=A0A2S4VEJ8_9BASI|nr:hypothetical protein PSTT_07987 [Puccinia striiformis]
MSRCTISLPKNTMSLQCLYLSLPVGSHSPIPIQIQKTGDHHQGGTCKSLPEIFYLGWDNSQDLNEPQERECGEPHIEVLNENNNLQPQTSNHPKGNNEQPQDDVLDHLIPEIPNNYPDLDSLDTLSNLPQTPSTLVQGSNHSPFDFRCLPNLTQGASNTSVLSVLQNPTSQTSNHRASNGSARRARQSAFTTTKPNKGDEPVRLAFPNQRSGDRSTQGPRRDSPQKEKYMKINEWEKEKYEKEQEKERSLLEWEKTKYQAQTNMQKKLRHPTMSHRVRKVTPGEVNV